MARRLPGVNRCDRLGANVRIASNVCGRDDSPRRVAPRSRTGTPRSTLRARCWIRPDRCASGMRVMRRIAHKSADRAGQAVLMVTERNGAHAALIAPTASCFAVRPTAVVCPPRMTAVLRRPHRDRQQFLGGRHVVGVGGHHHGGVCRGRVGVGGNHQLHERSELLTADGQCVRRGVAGLEDHAVAAKLHPQ